MKRQFTMLAQSYTDTDPQRESVKGWLMSEKLDGQRALWDGGCSVGLPKWKIPWSNTLNILETGHCICTGLWTRLGNIIHCPDWWTKHLPQGLPLDGELTGRYRTDLSRQELRSIVSRHKPITIGWQRVWYHVFDIPNKSFLSPGTIDIPNCYINIKAHDYHKWEKYFHDPLSIFQVYKVLEQANLPSFIKVVPQERLINPDALDTFLHNTISMGGEGLMLRDPQSTWTPHRSPSLLKVKSPKIGRATVLGYRAGKGKYLGMMGSLIVTWQDKQFEISGFTDEERRLVYGGHSWALKHPGETICTGVDCNFENGDEVDFKYASLTDGGIPIEARYQR